MPRARRSRSRSKRFSPTKRRSRSRSRSRARKYAGVRLTYLTEQAFQIGTLPIRLIPFGARWIDKTNHTLFHTLEPVPYKMRKGVINFLANYGFEILLAPLELIPLVGHGVAESIKHKLFFRKRVYL